MNKHVYDYNYEQKGILYEINYFNLPMKQFKADYMNLAHHKTVAVMLNLFVITGNHDFINNNLPCNLNF